MTDWADAQGAFRLLYKNYLERGLIDPNAHGLRFTHFNLLESSATFVARLDGRVIATLSVMVDCPSFGIPMDALYHPELKGMRRRELRPAEGSGLAVDPEYRPIGMYIVMNLVKMAIHYAQCCGADTAVIACHPKHTRFYEDVFLFEQFGECRTYGAVNGAPAVALELPISGLEEKYRESSAEEGPGIYRYFFTDEFFRCPDMTPLQGALSPKACRELCQLQPEIVQFFERREPGLVASRTGWGERLMQHRFQGAPSEGPFIVASAFVAA
ncbi:MAG: hypothetical protein P1P84_03615 [Deferrisomatales bacterium]|nr:hypothetical protein [Deferrisomatales bacterium]